MLNGHHLNRIDDYEVRLVQLDQTEQRLDPRLRHQQQFRGAHLQAPRAQRDLLQALLAGDVQHPLQRRERPAYL